MSNDELITLLYQVTGYTIDEKRTENFIIKKCMGVLEIENR
jgi:hypothetical protein